MAPGKLSGAFDVLIVSAKTSVPTESLVAPAGYVIRLAGAGDIAADWETVELPSSDGGLHGRTQTKDDGRLHWAAEGG